MRHSMSLVAAAVVVLGGACGSVDPAGAEEESPVVVDGKTPLTHDQLQSLVDAAAKSPAVFPATACPSPYTCGSSYGSCTAWSAPITCGSPGTCNLLGCKHCTGIGQCTFDGSYSQPRYQYQTCFDLYGNQCTNVSVGSTTVCGCD